jgi:TRAP-type uncharacterized transport system substrate-binding protein
MVRLIAAAILAVAFAAPASAAEDRIARLASGIEGGTYHDVFARQINEKVDGWRFENRATRGSTDNLDLLSTGEVELAITQSDVFASRILEEPEVFGDLVVLGGIAEECVFVARRREGGIDSFAALSKPVGDRAAIINVGPRQTGMAESWNYVCSLMPEQSDADLDNASGIDALERLARGEIEAVGWVTAPSNPDHVLLKAVRDDDRFDFVALSDERLAGKLPDGMRVYQIRRVPIPGTSAERSVETICTTSLLVVRPDADPDLVYAISVGLFDNEKKGVTEPAR